MSKYDELKRYAESQAGTQHSYGISELILEAVKDAERYRYARWHGILKKGKPMDTYFVYNVDADTYVDAELANRSPENH